MTDKDYMERAIALAKKGIGWTNPNPLVGAVIVKDGRIIGEGYHHKYGEKHAERDAIANLSESAEGATIYVTLEPCCHFGKQPPCTHAIVENKISRVIIGSRDPNPLVSGKGTEYLRANGVEVIEDFMRHECDELNPVFFHYITTKMPYVVMKYAMTMDGKIATRTGASKWITGERAREYVHEERCRYSAIMAGIGTILKDDPMLNVRGIDGAHQPLRVIIDSNISIPMDSAIVRTSKEYPTVVMCNHVADEAKADMLKAFGISIIEAPDSEGHVDIKKVMKWLADNKYDSVYIEGGGRIHEAALSSGVVNHASVYIAPKIFGGANAKSPVEGLGVEAPDFATMFELKEVKRLDDDILLSYDVRK